MEIPKRYTLLPMESNKHMAGSMAAITLVTFYDRSEDNNSDPANVIASIQKRMKEVLAANPWMMGRIVMNNDADCAELVVVNSNCVPEDYITVETNQKVFEYVDYCSLLDENIKYEVQKGDKLLDCENGVLTKMGIIKSDDCSQILVFLSMTHIIADAGTIYAVYRQLDLNEEVYSMVCERLAEYTKRAETELSVYPTPNNLFQRAGTVIGPLKRQKNYLPESERNLWKQPRMVHLSIDPDYIKAQKLMYNQNDEFVSTNDVITSWMTKYCPDVDYLSFAVTLRDRLSGLTNKHAGNYVSIPYIRKNDLTTPLKVRHWLKTVLSPSYSWEYYPESEKLDYEAFPGAVCSNWVGFYHDVPIDGFKQRMHLPLLNPRWEIDGKKIFKESLIMVVFVPRKGETAVFVISDRPEVVAYDFAGDSAVLATIMSS